MFPASKMSDSSSVLSVQILPTQNRVISMLERRVICYSAKSILKCFNILAYYPVTHGNK